MRNGALPDLTFDPGRPLALGESPVPLDHLIAASAPGVQVVLGPAARARILAARATVERLAAGDRPIYGLNTGLGGNLAHRLAPDRIEAFQVQLIRGRCIGIGAPFPEPVARTMLLSRLIGLAQGGSGISPAVLDLMIAMFNAGITPVVPGRGSIGAGDLGLCAHIGAAVIGRGDVFHHGVVRPAADALAACALAPARLGPKDGLAIINASAVTCGHAARVAFDLDRLLNVSMAAAALSAEGYAANPAIFDRRLAEARPASGQARAAARFRALLAGSSLHGPGAARSIQDALSFRAMSAIYGPALTAFDTMVDAVETELNAAADNPLVVDDDILSTANFHTPAIALACDTMAIVLVHLATASAYRVFKLMNPALTGLPRYLSPVGGASTGFNSLQKTMAALHAEVRLKSTPASLDALPVSDGVEDHAPHTPLAIRKLQEQAALLWTMVAIEALTAAQAIDLRRGGALGAGTRGIYDAVRAAVPMLVEDRELGPDVDEVAAALSSPLPSWEGTGEG